MYIYFRSKKKMKKKKRKNEQLKERVLCVGKVGAFQEEAPKKSRST